MRAVVHGWVAGFPTAGFLWHPLSYALGLRDLGHEVLFLEDSGDSPWGWDPESGNEDPTCRSGVDFLRRELGALGLPWCFRHAPSGRTDGLSPEELAGWLAEAEVLVDVSLTLPPRPEYLRIPHVLGIDTDPVFTQVRVARGDAVLAAVPHTRTRLFTFGRPPLPGQQHPWLPTRQPVHTASWPVSPPAPPEAPWTSVTTWKAYPPVEWEGRSYHAKDVSLRTVLDLPGRSGRSLSLALGAGDDHQEGAAVLRGFGWQLTDPYEATRSTRTYQEFLAASAGEIGVAKHGYVAARSGWFSERSCCYLASGRPVVAQDTGWSEWLPTGEGLFAYDDVDGAAAAMAAVAADPVRHATAARRLVEEHFEARDVCASLLEQL